jgi:hypothetical protein
MRAPFGEDQARIVPGQVIEGLVHSSAKSAVACKVETE